MNLTLNIGLAVNNGTFIEAVDAVQAAANAGFFIYGSEVHDSDTEPTLVLTATYDGSVGSQHASAYALAEALGQDCIAVYRHPLIAGLQGTGRLIGPRADAWGAFNPEFFILPGGERLGQQLARQQRQRSFSRWAEQRSAA